MNFYLSLLYTILGAIGGGAFQLFMAQSLPSSPVEWGNLSASVLLGGLAVYLATRTIPAMHKEHLDACQAIQAKSDQTAQDMHARCERMQEKFSEELKNQRDEHRDEIDRLYRERS